MDNFDPALISVVMPCHNAARFVRDALESALRQSYAHLEVIVVDDGSTDDTSRIVEAIAASHPGRVNLVYQPNSGPYAARNRGLAIAHGNFIAFLDATDRWHPDALERLHTAMMDTLADVAYCGWQDFGESATDTQPRIPPDYASVDAATLFLRECPWPVNGVLLRRQLIDTLHGFSERRPTAMDHDLWLRALAVHPGAVRVPEVLAYRRRHPREDPAIPRWQQLFDTVSVREDFLRRHPAQIAHLDPAARTELLYGQLLAEAYRCHWRRDLASSRRLFRRAARRSPWKARDAKYILASFLPAIVFESLIHFVDHRRQLKHTI
jgi:glycosyltransferase involved in cell wall biosynthesis